MRGAGAGGGPLLWVTGRASAGGGGGSETSRARARARPPRPTPRLREPVARAQRRRRRLRQQLDREVAHPLCPVVLCHAGRRLPGLAQHGDLAGQLYLALGAGVHGRGGGLARGGVWRFWVGFGGVGACRGGGQGWRFWVGLSGCTPLWGGHVERGVKVLSVSLGGVWVGSGRVLGGGVVYGNGGCAGTRSGGAWARLSLCFGWWRRGLGAWCTKRQRTYHTPSRAWSTVNRARKGQTHPAAGPVAPLPAPQPTRPSNT